MTKPFPSDKITPEIIKLIREYDDNYLRFNVLLLKTAFSNVDTTPLTELGGGNLLHMFEYYYGQDAGIHEIDSITHNASWSGMRGVKELIRAITEAEIPIKDEVIIEYLRACGDVWNPHSVIYLIKAQPNNKRVINYLIKSFEEECENVRSLYETEAFYKHSLYLLTVISTLWLQWDKQIPQEFKNIKAKVEKERDKDIARDLRLRGK